MFSSYIALQLLFDIGFSSTFVRALAIALAGGRGGFSFLGTNKEAGSGTPNWSLVNQVIGTMRVVYQRLSLLYLLFLITAGSATLIRPISYCLNTPSVWLAWSFIVLGSCLNLYFNFLGVLLNGLNYVALSKRSDALVSIATVLCNLVVVLSGGKLLSIVVSTQLWIIVGLFRNWQLCKTISGGRFREIPPACADKTVMASLWPATWRTGIGTLMSFGLMQTTGLINAQFATARDSASYLFAMRIIQLISSFSQAPFYSKLPVFPRLRAENKMSEFISIAAKSMQQSLLVYTVSFAILTAAGSSVLVLVKSNVDFPSKWIWSILGLVFFIERYAAMHLQLYSTSNKIISHIANGLTGVVCIVTILVLVPAYSTLALPVGLLIGYASIYSWYPVVKSYREFNLKFFVFERRVLFPSGGLLLLAIVGCLLKG